MERTMSLLVAVLLVAMSVSAAVAEPEAPMPLDVLLIAADDLQIDLGCHGVRHGGRLPRRHQPPV